MVGLFSILIIGKIDSKSEEPITLERGYTFDRIQNPDGTKNLVLYMGIRNVLEDNQWKRVEEAKSLINQPFQIIYLEKDDNYTVEVNDFNLTYINLKLGTKDNSKLNKDISLKKDGIHTKDKVSIVSKESKVSYEFNGINVLQSNFTFGDNSTTIILQTNDTENLEDTYVNSDDPTGAYPLAKSFQIGWQATCSATATCTETYVKWDLLGAGISAGSTINNATLNYNLITSTLDAGESTRVSFFHLYNQTWREEEPTWNTRISINPTQQFNGVNVSSYTFINSGVCASNCWIPFHVTEIVQDSLDLGEQNLSIYTNVTLVSGSPGLADFVTIRTKEENDASLRPYLNITYTEITDTCTYSSGNWNVNCHDNCTVSTTVNLGNNDLIINGYGRFTVASSGNIINVGDTFIVGQSAANQCILYNYGDIN